MLLPMHLARLPQADVDLDHLRRETETMEGKHKALKEEIGRLQSQKSGLEAQVRERERERERCAGWVTHNSNTIAAAAAPVGAVLVIAVVRDMISVLCCPPCLSHDLGLENDDDDDDDEEEEEDEQWHHFLTSTRSSPPGR